MSLNREHLALACTLYGGLRRQNPFLADLPENPLWVKWRYLPLDRWRCYGEAQKTKHGLVIAINPVAFEEGWVFILEGIINHEMVHLLIPEHGHDSTFEEYESGWEHLLDFRDCLRVFRDESERLAVDRTIVHIYKCPECSIEIKTDRMLPQGTACKLCCMAYGRGRHDSSFALKYVGRTRFGHGRQRDPDPEEANEQRTETSDTRGDPA